MTTPQIARILAGASPAPVGAAEAKSHGALDRGHHRGEVMAEAIRAKCATPGYARAVAPFAAEATSRTRHSAWVVAGADEEAEYRGEVAAETHELPKSVAQALANLSNAPGGVAARAFVDAEERFGVDATSAVATCLACARFGLTRDELKAAATRRVRAQHARAEQHAKARREEGAEDSASAEAEAEAEASASAEASARASKYARARASLDEGFDALFATFRPWLAPWCSRDAWAREMEPFDEDEDDDDQTRPNTQSRPLALASAELENAAAAKIQIPCAFRDAYARAAALERYAPPHAVDPIDGERVRRRLHADLAAHFLPLPDYLRLNLPRFDDGFSPRARRRIRAGAWHAAAGGEHDAVARTLARRGVVAALCLPGARSDVAAAATDGIGAGIPRDATLLWASWEERARAWMDATGDDLPEGDRDGSLLEGSLPEGGRPSGSLPEGSLPLTSAAGAPLMTRAAAREYDLGAIASSSRSFSGRMGECAGAALALSGMFSWLGAPDAAASLLARARRWFGPPKGRSGVTCALALAHARALFRARARRPGEEARALARETCAAAELFASGASGDHTGVFPRAWRVAHLRACGEATSASLCSPASLYARAATLRADIADADAATIGTDDPTNEEWVRVVERAGEWRARETEAWRRAALATASPRVARALAAAMAGDETSERAVVAAVDTRRERRDGEYADENVLDDADDDDEFGDAKTHDVIGLVRALRRRRFASARAGRRDDAAETADRLVAVVVAALGDDHPECGAAKLEAAELASAAAAATAGGTRTDTNGSATGSPLDDVSAYASASAWARPAYDFAEAFYGARSLPAARAAWCVAEALRLVSGAASARPMFAQALGAASAVLGPRHPGVGAMMIAVGERSRVEGRLEEADALLRDGFATAEAEADAAAREEEWAVAAGIAAIVPAKGQSGGEESKEGGGEELHHSTIEPHHSEPHPAIVAAATSATAAAERRSRLADASTARAANAVARARTDAGDARAAETFRRLALAAAERAMGPAHPSVASTLGALGACAVVRRRFEDADAYFRHAVGVDERAARAGRARGATRVRGSSTRASRRISRR